MTGAEVAAEAGVDIELARRLRRAMGLPDVAEEDRVFTDDDRDALVLARRIVEDERLTESELMYLTRNIGLAAARMADAVVGLWADRLQRFGMTGPAAPEELVDPQRIADLEQAIIILVRRHVEAAAARYFTGDAAASEHVLAVGFADLVGFTMLTEQLSEQETADLVERFEAVATDTVGSGGGRVIKMIGDEVMFASEPAQMGEIALNLSEIFSSPGLPGVRVGAASGRVVAQSGDLFGPVVNLAARATVVALPGAVLISPALADALEGDERYRIKPLRPRRLKGIGVVELRVLRRATRRAD